jgi:hypothetical protein
VKIKSQVSIRFFYRFIGDMEMQTTPTAKTGLDYGKSTLKIADNNGLFGP